MAPVDFPVSVLQKLPQLILLLIRCLPKPEPNWLWAGSESSGSDQKIRFRPIGTQPDAQGILALLICLLPGLIKPRRGLVGERK